VFLVTGTTGKFPVERVQWQDSGYCCAGYAPHQCFLQNPLRSCIELCPSTIMVMEGSGFWLPGLKASSHWNVYIGKTVDTGMLGMHLTGAVFKIH
jgi:hypothetical protein